MDDLKSTLQRYLQSAREALLWKLDGVSEYDARRPLTPTGTNLLGLVKHVASVEIGYFTEVFDRPCPVQLPWFAPDAEPNADMWAAADESRGAIIELYHTSWRVSDETISSLSLESPGFVRWWTPERQHTTLGTILVHMVAETHRHAGHADIVRETIDGAGGLLASAPNLAAMTSAEWQRYTARVRDAAERHR